MNTDLHRFFYFLSLSVCEARVYPCPINWLKDKQFDDDKKDISVGLFFSFFDTVFCTRYSIP